MPSRSHHKKKNAELKLPTIEDLSTPSILTGEAARRWESLAPELRNKGLLTSGNIASFILNCRSWGDVLRAQTHIDIEGDVVDGARGGKVRNPWYTIYHQALQVFMATSSAFGLTPSSLARVKAAESERQLSLPEYLAMMAGGVDDKEDRNATERDDHQDSSKAG
jgi:P27 family predicted phage terminase small subunit